MPGMNGMEATRQIRALPGARGNVRVVAVTAQAFSQQIEMCRQAGMDDHVSKPVKQDVLLGGLLGTRGTGSHDTAGTMIQAEPTARADLTMPVFDRATFEDATGFMAEAEVGEHLLTLQARCATLLDRLRAPWLPAQALALADDAHRLPGGAGAFGFLSTAAAARAFEVASRAESAGTELLADRLAVAIRSSMAVIRREVAASATAGS